MPQQHAGTGRMPTLPAQAEGGMPAVPTPACPRLSAWHVGPCLSASAPANRGPLQEHWRNPPIKGYSPMVWTLNEI